MITYFIFIDDMSKLKSGLVKIFQAQTKKFIVFIAVLSVCMISLKLFDFSRIIFFGTTLFFFIVKSGLSLWVFYYFNLRNQKNERPAVIIGNNKIGNELFRYFFKNSYLGLKPVGILDDRPIKSFPENVIGSIEDFQGIYDKNPFQDVIIALPLSDSQHIKELIELSERNGVRPHIVPNYYGAIDRTFKVQLLGNIPLLNFRCAPLDRYPNRFWKRAFDLFFGTIMLLMLSPLFVIIAVIIKAGSKGPVFYKPIRLGVNGKPFEVYKFRSMYNSNDTKRGTKSTVVNDSRITKAGKFLRKYNLDELPQLLNVLNNEMSLVGPRPHRTHLNITLKQKMNYYMVRHLIKPGITGWAQVNGWRGPTENRLQYMGRTLHDLWYIENWTFWLDVYILYLTLFGKKTNKNAF